MKKIKNFIMEALYRSSKFIVLIIILAISSLIIYSALGNMFNKDYSQNISYDKEVGVDQESKEVSEIEVNIPSDASPLDVSKILISGKLINDEEKFLNYLEENNIVKFKQGNFKLNKNMSFEEIANTIKA
ncbi:MAG: hypothetical protein SPI59_06015 [Finegoldia sp.]|nr:hypothetical protein [Finegoldia sp.]